MECHGCMTPALLGALLGAPEYRAYALAKREAGMQHIPPPGSLEENVRVRRWLVMDVSYD